MIGGRLKSDLRFANTLTWNTFPVPELDEKTRERIIKAGQRECLMVCVWEPIPHKEISQNDYCDKTRSGR